MSTHTDEFAFETTVESMLLAGGWGAGDRQEWDVDRALFSARALAFIRDTQPELWAEMSALHGASLESTLIETLVKEFDNKGSLHVLRHGFRFFGKTFRLAYFKPASGLNPDALARFARNELTVTRQARCHPGKGDEVDLLFALNGVPVATCELKNPMTGQTWRNAVRQYQQDRDPNVPLFRFQKRALVHFAADPEEVHMTTRLAGEATRFLPFNRGSDPGAVRCGAGNPLHPSGYRTGYFWQEVLERERFLDILGSYVFVEHREEKVEDAKGARTEKRETVIFPRYHQLDSVSKLVAAAEADGPGRNYLIQHSAGSGKTNSISWLSHRLASLHNAGDEKVYHCVIVITDRRVLDQQLQDAIYQIEHAQGVVKAIDQDSQQLARALVDGTMIVITTLQKFPFVLKGLLTLTGAAPSENPSEAEQAQAAEWQREIARRRYAVIVDEAHSSQTGETAREMKAILGVRAQEAREEDEDWQDGLTAVVESRGPQPNLSFFAFTATPKGKTVELFGRPGPGGKPESFHVYSMRQAIEERFILDVLQNYVDYNTYYRIAKQAADDPNVPKRRTAVALARYMTLHPYNIEQKTEVIVEHFREHVRHRIGGRAKAMVVTSSRLHAVRYMLAFKRYIAEHNYDDIRPLVAFSGTVTDPDTGEDFTEPGMNIDVVSGQADKRSGPALALRLTRLPDPARGGEVPDRLRPAAATSHVRRQAARRRAGSTDAVAPQPGRARQGSARSSSTSSTTPTTSATPSRPYYDRTELLAASDPYQLEQLKHELDAMQVYHWSEVAGLREGVLPAPSRGSSPETTRASRRACCPRATASTNLGEDDQNGVPRPPQRVREPLRVPQPDHPVRRQRVGAAHLVRTPPPPLPPARPATEAIDLGDDVTLEYYRLERVHSGAVSPRGPRRPTWSSPSAVGTGNPEDEKAPLSEIIERLNERFGTEFTDEDRLFFEQVKERALRDDDVRQIAVANPFDKFSLGIRERLGQLMVERMGENDALVTRYLSDRGLPGGRLHRPCPRDIPGGRGYRRARG